MKSDMKNKMFENTSLSRAIVNAYKKHRERNWDSFYWMIDIHGVLVPSSYLPFKSQLEQCKFDEFYEDAITTLTFLMSFPEMKFILWSSSTHDYLEHIKNRLVSSHGLPDDRIFINANPEQNSTDVSDFSMKPYFSVLLDDKAGFEPTSDWKMIYSTVLGLKE